jgi:hypothetical protein
VRLTLDIFLLLPFFILLISFAGCSFDTTGSMYHYVGEVKTKVEQIVEELLRDVPSTL